MMDNQEYLLHTMGPSVFPHNGHGPQEMVHSRRTQKENSGWNRVGAQFCTMFRFTFEAPTKKEDLMRIKDFIFHHQLNDVTPKVVSV